MNILILSAKDDNGGIGIGIKRAFEQHAPEHEVHSVTRHNNFIGWDADIVLRDDNDRAYVQELFGKADVIHIMDLFSAADGFSGYERKPKVFHHHGLDFRQNSGALMARCRAEGIQQIVATHDLLAYGDDLTWLPNPCDITTLQFFRKQNYRPSSLVRVAQSPTSLQANGTRIFLDAVDVLPIDVLERMQLDIIQNLPWTHCMRRKAQADIVLDSFGVGYGITTIEAWGMGIPVVHGASAQTQQAVLDSIGYSPYYHVTPETTGAGITDMVCDEDVRKQYAELGWQAVNDFHAESEVVRRLLDIYERAIG